MLKPMFKVTEDRVAQLLGYQGFFVKYGNEYCLCHFDYGGKREKYTPPVKSGGRVWLKEDGNLTMLPEMKTIETYPPGCVRKENGKEYYLAQIVPNKYISERSKILQHLRAAAKIDDFIRNQSPAGKERENAFRRLREQIKKACSCIKPEHVRMSGLTYTISGNPFTCTLQIGGVVVKGGGKDAGRGSFMLSYTAGRFMEEINSFKAKLEDVLPSEVKRYASDLTAHIEGLLKNG